MTAPVRAQTFAAATAPLNVVIIGGGIGGLCLAQGLKKAGVSGIFQPGTAMDDIVKFIRERVKPQSLIAG